MQELIALLGSNAVTSVDIVQAFLQQINHKQELNAYITVLDDGALQPGTAIR